MTKKEREVTQAFVNQTQDLRKLADEAFKILQDENGKINGKRWCCASQNYIELLKAGHDYTNVYNKYVEARAKDDLIMWFGQDLANIGFWKQNK